MFKNRRTFLIFLSALPLLACERKIDLSPREPKWDRDVCARCAMMLSDRLNSAQIIDAQTGDAYLFDDFGCAVAWLDEKQPAWRSDAIIYLTDASDGAWLKSEEAVLATPFITPMSFGIAAFRNKEKMGADKTVLSFQEAEKIVLDSVRERKTMKHPQ
ncbi:MAG: hypothetical protein LBE75_00590 [Burkholderiales bacterium]|nr:hypothetical protein [Burkholderiales bacterium]